ncbi:DNA polymerase III subunit delta' [Varibaculum prostatecancerukia]|uniref:DNA polymerase III subunit delta' n=1 Tax=Varibaculum prostatecancerukia TaxID=2811781 RepID=UPI001C002BEC|nr:DNA polymerase III subunit delta' [Varibaculum prostatecancerukia]
MSVWDQIVGQKAAVAVFEAAARAARSLRETGSDDAALARQMAHAWLITGPAGAGRSVAALAFAAALQCEDPQTPGCGQCPECKRVLKGTHPDVKVVTTERLIIKIEEIASLVTLAQQAPAGGKWRVILMEDADRMVERSSNLLLKAIEEPPPRTVWLLCTTQPGDVLPTIRSRCRHLSLVTPSVEEVAQLLIEREGIAPETARQAAALSQSHIGVAKSLARDPAELDRRRKILLAATTTSSVGEAAMLAQQLVEAAKTDASERAAQKDQEELTRLRRSLGYDQEGARLPAALKAQETALKADQKRRATRYLRDSLDRVLLNLLGFYRDVYLLQSGATVPVINVDLEETLGKLAQGSSAARTLARIDAIRTARKRLGANVTPLLTMEAMMMDLRL